MDDEVVAHSMWGLLDHVSLLYRLYGKFLSDLLQFTLVVDIGVLQGRLRIIEHSVQIDRLRRTFWRKRTCISERVKYAFPLDIAIRFRCRELSDLAELTVSLCESGVLEVWFNTGAASFFICLSLAEIDVSQYRPWLPISNPNLGSTLLS